MTERANSRKHPWAFYGQAALLMVLFLGVGKAFFHRYRLGIDIQQVTSLPYHLYWIDRQDHTLKRGAFYVLASRGLSPLYPDGAALVKQLVGLPGDQVCIDAQAHILINGQTKSQGLALAKRLAVPTSAFQGCTRLAADQYWLLGWHPHSLDSRYFGAVRTSQIIGRAYAWL
jgi:conjugal transfer pilin signal peptidase TrbI